MDEQNNTQPILMLTSRVTQKAYTKFFFHWMSCNRKGYLISLAIVVLLLVFLMALLTWRIIDGSNDYVPFLFLPLYFIKSLLPGRFYYMHREMYRSLTYYAFYEAHLYASCDVMGTRHYKATPYKHFTAGETKSAFYLYCAVKRTPQPPYADEFIDPDPYGASVILDKEQLSPEQQEALRALFAEKFGEKFKQHKR